MGLDKKAIETISVNAVRNSVVTSEFLDQYIPDNDKEPSWDGFVYIYGNKSKKKSNLRGRMAVQVKGKECNDLSNKSITFQMSVSDLKNYLYDGGCILFVVYIGNSGITTKIYYAELTPIKLRHLLEHSKSQRTKSVQLKEFPSDNNKKATIFLNCLQNCQKQASFKEGKLLSLEELKKQGVLENIVIPFAGVGNDDPQMALINNEVYIYAKIKGSSIPHPIDVIPEDIHTQQIIDSPITIDGKLFYTGYSVVKSADGITLHYGESLTIKFSDDNQSCKLNYKNSDKIRVLAKDLDFMLTYLDKGYFEVNNVRFPFSFNGMNIKNFEIKRESENLIFAKKVVQVLDLLGCSDDINTNDLNDEDWKNLKRLVTAFLDKKPIRGLKIDLPYISCITIGKLKFAVYLKRCQEKGTYEIYDFFKTDLSVVLMDKKRRKMFPVSQYSILTEDDFLSLSNMNFDVLLPSFKKNEHNYVTVNRANMFLLDLLNAYDKANGEKKDKLLKVCKDFSSWLSKFPNEELDYQVKTLNRLQTIKRYRDFSIDEISTLYAMVEDKDTREESRVGAYLLLGQQQAAKIHFDRLSRKAQNEMKKYPIYHFWKPEENNNGQT